MTNTPTRLLAGALALLPAVLTAQTPSAEAKKKPAETAPAETVELEKLEVTGSRIRTLGDDATAIPVFSIPQLELERRGVTRLADIRWAIPQLAASVGFNDNLTNSGTSRAQTVSTSFNLRGLGGNSTLVLVDGRRVPHTGQEAPGGAGGREDFSVDGLPVGAIERIEILPQGAGAIYGSEAIAGVVNIILKKNYQGAELNVSYDNTFKSDVGQTTVSLTTGVRKDKLSVFLTASMEEQNGMASRDRWFTSTNDLRAFGSTSTSYLSGITAGAGSLSTNSFPGSATGTNLPGLSTHVVLLPSGSNGTTATNAGYTATNAAGVPIYDSAAYAISIDPAARRSILARVNYQLFPKVELYGTARYSRYLSEYVGTPITLSTTLPVGAPGNPFSSAAILRKVFYDLPLPQTDSYQLNSAVDIGARGSLFADWRYDVNAAWAQNIVRDDALTPAGFTSSLVTAALASGTPPILAYDSSKVKEPNAAGVLAALMPMADHEDTTEVTTYSINADGTVWSYWAGDIKAALGAEAGEEKVNFWREASIVTPTYVLTKPFSRDYTAAYTEVTLPLLSARQGIPLVHLLEAGGAVRATDYSDVGAVTTPTYRGRFQPVKWLTLRASRTEGFKPVRLYDLQAPVSTFSTTYTATSNIRDPYRGGEAVLGTFSYKSGGNPSLKPEESTSKNAGIVLDVPGDWFKGLSFSADYYQILYSERSGSTGLQTLLNYFPERVTRAAPTAADIAAGYAGVITTWDASNVNLSWVKTKGWDYRASYNRKFDFGHLLATAAMSDPNLIITKSTPAATPTTTGTQQAKRMSGSLFLARGAWDYGISVNYQARYFISGLSSPTLAYPSYIEWNPQVSYNFAKSSLFDASSSKAWANVFANSKVSLTIINAFNNEPSLAAAANGRVVMDPRLRRYIVSVSKKF